MPNEVLDDFIVRLRQQGSRCEVKMEYLEIMMINQIVDKCTNAELRRKHNVQRLK